MTTPVRSALAGIAVAVALALPGALSPAPAEAASDIDVAEQYYEIEGNSVDDLRAQMADLGPFSARADAHVPARMESRVDFRFVSQWRRGRCRVEQVRVRAQITYRYPRWSGHAVADAALADRWNAYLARLVVHEEGHGEIIMDAVAEVDAALRSTPPSRNCAALRASARARGAAILERARDAQIEYDRETGGGAEQGAVLREPDETT